MERRQPDTERRRDDRFQAVTVRCPLSGGSVVGVPTRWITGAHEMDRSLRLLNEVYFAFRADHGPARRDSCGRPIGERPSSTRQLSAALMMSTGGQGSGGRAITTSGSPADQVAARPDRGQRLDPLDPAMTMVDDHGVGARRSHGEDRERHAHPRAAPSGRAGHARPSLTTTSSTSRPPRERLGRRGGTPWDGGMTAGNEPGVGAEGGHRGA